MVGLVFLFPAWLIKSAIAAKLVLSLEKLSFEMPYVISGKELAGLITLFLTQLGMTVTVEGTEAVVTNQTIRYYIKIYPDQTFGILFDPTLASRLFTGRRYISQYKKAIVVMSLIAFIVQSKMNAQDKGTKISGEKELQK